MRVSCLAGGGRDGTGTWFVLRWKSVTFVVDAPVAPEHATPEDAVQAVTYKLGKKDPKAISPVQQATVNPFDHVDPEEVDVVLVSSYESLLGAYSFLQAEGFHGQVFASDPSVQFGKMLRRCAARAQHVGSSTLHHPPLETLDDIDIQIRTVALRERIPILRGIFLQPVGSGYSVGACNWVISDATMSVGLVGPSCTAAKRHPAALDKQQLQMCSALVFRNLSAETESPNDRLNQFGSFLASTIARGGSVVVPVRLNGILFDLIEITSKVLRRTNMHAPIFLVSPQGKQALAFANAYCMWLSKEKQKPLYSANWPFNHHNLVETGRLRLFESITDPEFHRAFREPCIIFADDPGLRFGPVVRAIELIKSSPNSALVLVEADLHAEAALARFQPLRCQVMQFTIDPRLRTQEVARLVNDSNAQIVIAPTAIPLQGRPRECRLLRAGETHTIEPETPLTVTSALMDPQLLARLKPNQTLTDVAGVLSVRDYEYLLRADDVHHRDDDQHPAKRPRRPSLAALIAAFHMAGEFDLHVRRRGTTYKVSCAALGATISVEGTQTSVEIEDTGRYHDDSVGEEEGKGEDVKDVKAEVTDERGEPTAGPATIAMKTEDDEEEHEQQQQQQQQQDKPQTSEQRGDTPLKQEQISSSSISSSSASKPKKQDPAVVLDHILSLASEMTASA